MLVRDTVFLPLFSTVFLCLGATSFVCADEKSTAVVEVVKISQENWESVVPAGKEVDAIIGDLVLKNQYVTAVIAQPVASRNANMTVRSIAGCLIDFTTNEHPGDQLSAYYPGARTYPFRSWEILDLDGKQLDLKKGAAQSKSGIQIQVKAEAADARAELVVCYQLRPDSRDLIVKQIYRNTTKKDLPIFILDEIRLDGGKEDQLKSPNGSNELFWIDDRFWKQAYGISAFGKLLSSRSDSRRSSLRYGSRGSKPATVLKPGEEHTHEIRWHVASDLCDILLEQTLAAGQSAATTAITVLASGTRVPNARVELSKDGKYAGTLWSDGSGRIDQTLPTGTYLAKVSYHGIALIKDFQLHVEKGVNTFAINTSMEVGTLKIRVVDTKGASLPCKVALIGKSESNKLNFGPESAEVAVKNLLYLYRGEEEILLPAGEYEAIISRGPEYDAVFSDISIGSTETTSLNATLNRVVDTTGWVSTEFHSHSSPSGDNTGSQLGRVLNLLCEHLEFAPCTEHNRIDTYAPHIKTLGIEKYLATCTGMELTGSPLPLNHQNVFPLIHKPHRQDGGGPLTDTSPEKQIQRAALWDNRSDKLIQQNHPDIGWLFYDKNGDGKPDGGYSEALQLIEAIEIHPLGSILKLSAQDEYNGRVHNNRMINWLQLLNQGYRITGVVNTDAHYNFHGSGGLRNWVKCSTDLPAEINTLEIVHATEQAHSIMSNGPFLNVLLTDPENKKTEAIAGDEIIVKSGKLDLHIRVQCPNWFDIDRVFVLVNGKLHESHDYKRATDAEKFQTSVVKFDNTLRLELKEDAHIVVVTAGENSQLGPVLGPGWGKQQPIAVSNPVFVDINGDGFKPNFDPVYGALPVKAK